MSGMAWSPLELNCPSCQTAVWTELDAGLPTAGDTDRLWGRDLCCRQCDYEFEVLFYPEGE